MHFHPLSNGRIYAPVACPYCHITQLCTHLSHVNKYQSSADLLIVFWRCTSPPCARTIITENNRAKNSTAYLFERFVDSYPQMPVFPLPISELKSALDSNAKSNFEKTYLQSLMAESAGLDEIAGMGYRKAIEYLVKDLAAQKNPGETSMIIGKTLTAVIKDYFTGDMKDILERAVWLGNDQTHYFKIFEQFDIVMLKELIDFVLSDLDREYKKNLYNSTILARNGSA